MRFLLKFSYDGTNYSGFQNQPGLSTIQQQLENALEKVNNGQKTTICATGRTDKGVHALCQYAHVDLSIDITEAKLKRALNSNLPADIHIISTKVVDKDFHARYSVKQKEYKYYINLGEYNPLERNYVFQYNHELDIGNMSRCAGYSRPFRMCAGSPQPDNRAPAREGPDRWNSCTWSRYHRHSSRAGCR